MLGNSSKNVRILIRVLAIQAAAIRIIMTFIRIDVVLFRRETVEMHRSAVIVRRAAPWLRAFRSIIAAGRAMTF